MNEKSIMSIYIDVYKTKNGMKISIFGDGYLVLRAITMSTVCNTVKSYNNDLTYKYGDIVKLNYYIDYRGIGFGVYELLQENLGKEINLYKLDIV